MSRSHPPRNTHLRSWERVAKSPNTRTATLSTPCLGLVVETGPKRSLVPATSPCVPLLFPWALSSRCQPLLGKVLRKPGEQSRCPGRKLMQQIVKQPSSPGLRAGHGPGERASCLLPAGTGRVEARPSELGSEVLLAEALPAEQGSSSADAATSSMGSPQGAHWS